MLVRNASLSNTQETAATFHVQPASQPCGTTCATRVYVSLYMHVTEFSCERARNGDDSLPFHATEKSQTHHGSDRQTYTICSVPSLKLFWTNKLGNIVELCRKIALEIRQTASTQLLYVSDDVTTNSECTL